MTLKPSNQGDFILIMRGYSLDGNTLVESDSVCFIRNIDFEQLSDAAWMNTPNADGTSTVQVGKNEITMADVDASTLFNILAEMIDNENQQILEDFEAGLI